MAFFFQSRRTPPPPAPDESTLNVPLRRFELTAFGKEGLVQYLAPNGDDQASRFEAAARAAVANLEGRLSLGLPGSAISRINAAAGGGAVAIDAETEAFLKLCDSVPFMTQGGLDPSAGPLLRLWESLSVEGRVAAADEVAKARALVGWSKLRRSAGSVSLPEKGMSLDFGCLIHGLAADTVAQLASAHGIPGILAQVGPATRSAGQPPGKSAWALALESFKAGEDEIAFELFNRSVAVAGGMDHAVTVGDRRFAPIIDLKTGWPVSGSVIQVVVLAPSAIQASVIANAAFIQGLPGGIDFIQSFPGCEGMIATTSTRGTTRGYRELVRRG